MQTINQLVQQYEVGNYTLTDLMLGALELVTDDNVDVVLSSLPKEAIVDLRQFVDYYHLGTRVFNAPKPSMAKVRRKHDYRQIHCPKPIEALYSSTRMDAQIARRIGSVCFRSRAVHLHIS